MDPKHQPIPVFSILIPVFKKCFTFLMLFLFWNVAHVSAQNTDEELAAQYYQSGEFEKAADLYRKLFKDNEQSVYYYDYYFNSLIKSKNYQEAEKTLKRISKKKDASYHFVVDLAYLESLKGNEAEALKQYEAIIKSVPQNQVSISQLANAFIKRGLNQQATLVYELGNQWFSADIPFGDELIQLYQFNKEFKKLIPLALEMLRIDPTELEFVQKEYSRIIDLQAEKDFLREKVLIYQQKYPEMPVYGDLSMWLFEQYREFKAALRQAIAIDKKEKGEGSRIFSLAAVCISLEEYDVAVDGYRYIIEKGEDHVNYMRARNGLLDVQYLKVTKKAGFTSADIEQLVAEYTAYLNQYGQNWNTADAMKRLAEIYLFYSHEVSKAISLMEGFVELSGVHPLMLADVKLMLGDAYLIDGNIWDAQLVYGQVDKDFKEEPLGQEARFRNARLSYFTGDFAWAKDQLEVLKTATSQFISNNAIELSLRIQDNTGLDSTEAAMMDYAKADLLFFQNKLDACMMLLNEIPFKYPGHSLEDDIAYLKGQVMEQKRNYEEAIRLYERVVANYGDDILADNALYRLAFIYQNILGDKEKAKSCYEKIVLDYSSSLFVIEARKQYQKLRSETVGSGS